MLGGGAMILLVSGLTQEEAFAAIDLNVIFLLMGMMIIAHLLGETGVFQWLAIKAVKLAGGRPVRVLILLSLVTAVVSAFLDNVTVVVLIAPVTLFVAEALGVNPIPLLIAQILASNLGGTATLIGDPPNILIGSASELGFNDFLLNAAPFVIFGLAAFSLLAIPLFGPALRPIDGRGRAGVAARRSRFDPRSESCCASRWSFWDWSLSAFCFMIRSISAMPPWPW